MPIISQETPILRMAGDIAHVEPTSGGSVFVATMPGIINNKISTFGDIRLVNVSIELDTIFRKWTPNHTATVDGVPAKSVSVKELGDPSEWRIRIVRPGSTQDSALPATATVMLSYSPPTADELVNNGPITLPIDPPINRDEEEEKARIGFMVGLLLSIGAAVIIVALLRKPRT